ncbi:PAS domain S-box protein [Xylanibacillus composti]|uniref:histidine kinase n=1 Tax=Xylanibacillus composti TaxID=1572762 RepID=A0A8J4H4K4_9BACL|nr:PAS domain S-box protein [Xylanibacillus composti]GIQ70739.1 hypothetical protein XYCOK13_35630 [Xylanibacillus composti]
MLNADTVLFEHSPLGIACLELTGLMKKVNPAFCELFGYREEELLHLNFSQLAHDEGRGTCIPSLREIEDSPDHKLIMEKQLVHHSGKIIYAQVSFSLLIDERCIPCGLLVQVHDKTELLESRSRAPESCWKLDGEQNGTGSPERNRDPGVAVDVQAEFMKTLETLHETEVLYRNLIERALVGVYLYQDGELVYVNPYLANMFGYAAEEFVHSTAADAIIQKECASRLEQTVHAMDQDVVYEYQTVGVKKNQQTIHLEGSCSAITYRGRPAVLGTVQDITYKKQAEELLRENAKRYQRLLKYLPEAILVIADGMIIYANKSAVELTRADSEGKLIGQYYFDLLHPDYHEETRISMEQVMQTDAASAFVEKKIYCATGEWIEVEASSIRIHSYNGNSVILTVLRDITERKKEEDLLIQSEKLSVVGQLAAGVAHEIRNPLTSLKGFTQLLKSKLRDRESNFIDIMQEELDRINLIVNEFMTLAKPHLIQYSDKNVKEILRSVISVLETQAILANVNLVKDYDENLPIIYCDENQLKQVLLNVIKNAIEAMPQGGDIRITVKKKGTEALSIQVQDHGPGIPADMMERIGEPFFTTKADGTGLGLMISRRIIDAHQGTFRIWSEPDRGTTVEIELPASGRSRQLQKY